ncbi:TraI domain-containing protein [Erwinia amylovora]|uniref:TraI domain-containing protein n=1 Tax=Erwinia amylovora TaxID=552 RepID=UPI001443B777|nr:TraI domain-containing protein [Erwinia amylovora]UDJ86304.1 TraI domain-containing protein [Erwinia amylovora]UDJ97764.1 TraI domain-containing protein [Erwinia amylovora]UDK90177.1 TraI domain-containing protein [Erwinia amylovora]UDK93568.1 TraI domain-containing protein [Erwinia amylovora]UOD74404.1 TraI domain-containing protein [Erwinia amylovora]
MRGLKWLTGRNVKAGAGRLAVPEQYGRNAADSAGFHPLKTGAVLLQTDERRRLIRVLTENSPLSMPVTEAWWLQPLEEMAARVQECPAAWNGPFSGPGGFTDLSLNVATRAVRLVRGMMLPPGATPEEQAEQGAGWACALYWAGLFHHFEWLTQMEGATKSGRPWYPGLNVPADQWRVRPKASPAGGMSAMYMAIRLLPAEGLIWLQRWPAISDSLLGFLAGSRAGSALLNNIVSDARNSCGFTGGTVTDVPPPAGVSPVMTIPETGHISPKLYENEAVPLSSVSSALPVENHIVTTPQPYTQSAENKVHPQVVNSLASDTALLSALGSEESIPADDESDDRQQQVPGGNLMSMLDLMAEGQPVPSADEVPVLPESAPAGEESISEVSRQESGKTEITDGERFLQWLRQSVTDGTLSVNESDSVLHILARFIFVASPDIFYKYLSSAGDDIQDKNQLQKSFEALSVHHSRNGKGLYHYHKYDEPDKSGRFIKVSGYMIETNLIFRKGSCPPDSIWLSPRS